MQNFIQECFFSLQRWIQVKTEMRNTVNAMLVHIQDGFVSLGDGLRKAIATEAHDNSTFANSMRTELEGFQR